MFHLEYVLNLGSYKGIVVGEEEKRYQVKIKNPGGMKGKESY